MDRLVVLGGGESGIGAALLGKVEGFEVFVSDKNTITKKYKDVLLNHGIEFEDGKHSESKIMNADIVMKSPGIPDTVPLIQNIRKSGIAFQIPLSSQTFVQKNSSSATTRKKT